MAHPFEIDNRIEVGATPEQVWDALTTGSGLDAWFMGRNEVERREGGIVRTVHPGFTGESTVTVWDPPKRFAHEGYEEGRVNGFDYLIEPRGSERTAVRWLHSGMLGDDWETVYEAMSEGDPMYFDKLAQYLEHFAGRTATPVDAYGPDVGERERAMAVFRRGLGLPDAIAVGDGVRLTPEGLEPVEGVVDWLSPSFLGVRTDEALLRFIYAFYGPVMVGHHVFSDVDQREAEEAWGTWLHRTFS